MTDKTRLRQTIKNFIGVQKNTEMPAFLGNLNGVVKVNDEGDIYVVLFNGEVLIVRNTVVPNVPRLPVIVGYTVDNPTMMQVIRERDVYLSGYLPAIPDHANKTHQWPQIDTLWVRGEQILPGLAIPSTGLNIELNGFFYFNNGWYAVANQTIDITSVIPATGGRYVLVEVNSVGTVVFNIGASKAGRDVLVPSDIPIPAVGNYPLFAVKTYDSQTIIFNTVLKTDIIDLRWSGYSSVAGAASSINWNDVTNAPVEIVEDLSSQITGSETHFTISHTATEKVTVTCGVLQPATSYYMDDDYTGFTLSYAPTLFDSLLVGYKYQ